MVAHCFFDFGNGEVSFDSYHERIVGILLHKYGLIRDFKEDENLHVRTNGSKTNSIDFLVGDSLIEFHPVHWSEKQRGIDTIKKAGERKYKAITNPEYQKCYFWHVWEIEGIYEVLQDSEIKPLIKKKYRGLSFEEFKKHLALAYKMSANYDVRLSNAV
ncbi:MAG: hypothetical protein Q8N99_01355 [Nanoarchaeota archaeon]|nr:hypothetical protein [Nanoarchaeota archaeon]